MHELVKNPQSPIFNDVQITASTWKPDGEAASNIPFDWRCRSFQTSSFFDHVLFCSQSLLMCPPLTGNILM
jgi:hypothetical protein